MPSPAEPTERRALRRSGRASGLRDRGGDALNWRDRCAAGTDASTRAAELNALPRLRWEGNLLPVWTAAKRLLRSHLDTLDATELAALQPAHLDALFQEIVGGTPAVIRARRFLASTAHSDGDA